MQYFRAVNMTKQEYFDAPVLADEDEECPERSGKLWEWCVNRFAGLFPYLLRTSSRAGGGDLRSIRHVEAASFAGRWAGDAVYLIGEYDASGLFRIAEIEFTHHGRADAGIQPVRSARHVQAASAEEGLTTVPAGRLGADSGS